MFFNLFRPKDISFSINGSKITFTKEGDIKIVANRNLILNGKYLFQNCSDNEIKAILFNIDNQCLEQSEKETL